MDMLNNLLLAYSLITSPQPPQGDLNPLTAVSVAHVAVQLQIMDLRETSYMFARKDEFATDLAMLRERFEKLREAPLVEDSGRLPDREWARGQMALNRRLYALIHNRFENRLFEAMPLLNDLERRYQLYDKIVDATAPYYYVGIRRQALLEILQTVGPEIYYGGKPYPSVIPLEIFEEVP